MPKAGQLNSEYTVHYRKWHNNNSEHVLRMIRFYDSYLGKHLPENRNSKILDIGCGMGFLLSFLEYKGFRNLVGIDRDASQIEAARKLTSKAIHIPDSALFLESHQETFEMIFLIDVLEHLDTSNQIQMLQKIKSALKMGGTLVTTVPNANSTISGRWRYIDFEHKSSFTEASLSYALATAGLSIKKLGGAPIYQLQPNAFVPAHSMLSNAVRNLTRVWRRLEFIGELGLIEGVQIPLEVNLMALARKD